MCDEPEAEDDLLQTIEEVKGSDPVCRVKLCHRDTRLPVRGTGGAAGYDIQCVEDTEVPPGKTVLVKTGLSWVPPDGTSWGSQGASHLHQMPRLGGASAGPDTRHTTLAQDAHSCLPF